MNPVIEKAYLAALNRLAKWRTVYAGWALGTTTAAHGPTKAAKDAAEAKLIMRVEITAISRLLIEKGIFTQDELMTTVTNECEHMQDALERKFPGMKATDRGIDMDIEKSLTTMQDLGFPP